MTYEEINPTPPLEIRKTVCQQTKWALGLFIYLHTNPLMLKENIQIRPNLLS
jgi:hypothetical protein